MKQLGLTSYYFLLGCSLTLFLLATAWFLVEQEARTATRAEQEIQNMVLRTQVGQPVPDCSHDAVYNFSAFGADYLPQRPELPPREKLQIPMFPGCESVEDYEDRVFCSFGKLREFIQANVRTPKGDKKGVVVVVFTIGKTTGKVYEPEVARTIGPEYSKEALRVIKLMQERDVRWTPGKIDGKPACIRFGVPVVFE